MRHEHPDLPVRETIRRNQRWNFWVNIGDLSFVHLAGSFVFISTIMPLYVSYLTESRVLIGLIPAIYLVASHVPQLFTAARAESLERKKPWIVRISVFERVPWLVLGLGIVLWPVAPPWFSYAFLVAMLLIGQGAVGVASPAWRAMLAKVIHPDRKGMMFGLGAAIGALMGAAGALLARHILDTMPYPLSFGICFLLAFAGQAISWTFLTFNREPATTPERARMRLGAYLRELPAVLRGDHNFARFLLSQVLVIFGALGVTFYVIYARDAFAVSDAFAATLTVVALVSQAVGTPLLGWWGDRFGHRNSIAPRKLPLNNMSPMLVLDGGGARLAVGASGGRRITNCVTSLVVKMLDFGLGPQAAIDAPRLDCSTPLTAVDGRVDPAVIDELRARRHHVGSIDPRYVTEGLSPFASPVAIARVAGGGLRGGADTFHGAHAAGL